MNSESDNNGVPPSRSKIDISDHSPQRPKRSSALNTPAPFGPNSFELGLPVPEGEPVKVINAIIERPDAQAFLQALHPLGVYELLRKAGWDQAMDLVALASPQQIQTFVDLDCWTKDEFIPAQLEPWLAALLEDASDPQLRSVLRELDPEILSLYFHTHLHVFEMEEGQVPDEVEAILAESYGSLGYSPDGVYAIVYPEDETTAALLRAFIMRLYDVDRVLAWTLLEAARWELYSPMREEAYRWRRSRLEEYGFVERDEAMEVYRRINPIKLREQIDSGVVELDKTWGESPALDLPAVIESEFDRSFFAVRVIEELSEHTARQRVISELTALMNRTMIADGIEPSERESSREVGRRTLGYLSLGFEFLSGSDLTRARHIAQVVALKDVFRTGYTLARTLQNKARDLRKNPTLTLVEDDLYSLLNPDERALFEALLRQRPTYAQNACDFDLLHTQAQLDDAARRIAKTAFKQVWLFGIQGKTLTESVALAHDPTLLNSPESIHFDVLFGTCVARYLVNKTTSLDPLRDSELGEFVQAMRHRAWQEDTEEFFKPILEPIHSAMPYLSKRLSSEWLKCILDRFEEEFGSIADPGRAELFAELMLISES